MTFINSMQERYTTKQFEPTKKIDPEKIDQLKEILRLSPSSINSQPWNFAFVQDEDRKKKLAEASYFNAEKVINCDTLVVFRRMNNLELFEKQIEENLPEGAITYYKKMIKPMGETVIKAWFDKQVYLALGVFLAACAEMGIDSTPMEGIEADKYNQILNDSDHHSLMAVAIGYRDANDANQVTKKPKKRRELDSLITSF